MGNGIVNPSWDKNSERTADQLSPENSLRTMISSFFSPNLPGSFFSETKLRTGALQVNICRESWKEITNLSYPSAELNKSICGIEMFGHQFFKELKLLDEDESQLRQLHIRGSKRRCQYERLLLVINMVKFILNIMNESFKTRSSIRAIGRSHARAGIREISVAIFNEVLLRTILRLLPSKYVIQHRVVEAWTSVLGFVGFEMTCEKITFSQHSSGDYSISNQSTISKLSEEASQSVARLYTKGIRYDDDDDDADANSRTAALLSATNSHHHHLQQHKQTGAVFRTRSGSSSADTELSCYDRMPMPDCPSKYRPKMFHQGPQLLVTSTGPDRRHTDAPEDNAKDRKSHATGGGDGSSSSSSRGGGGGGGGGGGYGYGRDRGDSDSASSGDSCAAVVAHEPDIPLNTMYAWPVFVLDPKLIAQPTDPVLGPELHVVPGSPVSVLELASPVHMPFSVSDAVADVNEVYLF